MLVLTTARRGIVERRWKARLCTRGGRCTADALACGAAGVVCGAAGVVCAIDAAYPLFATRACAPAYSNTNGTVGVPDVFPSTSPVELLPSNTTSADVPGAASR